jgi:uncharacterized protein
VNCPIDTTPLVMSERSGIEIDYCPTCRGVWLDRGELDKIIERSVTMGPPAGLDPRGRDRDRFRDDDDDYRGGYGRPGVPGFGGGVGGQDQRRRKRNWLEDLFD